MGENHGWTHANGIDPIPGLSSSGASSAWAWMERTTDLTLTSGSLVDVTAYTAGDTSDAAVLDYDLTTGKIFVLVSGIYIIAGQWGATTNFAGARWCSFNFGTEYIFPTSLGPVGGAPSLPDASGGASGFVSIGICSDPAPGGTPATDSDNRLEVGQFSGVSKVLDFARFAIVRVADY